MTLDGATLGIIFQGLAALAVALGLTSAGRSRRQAVDRGAYRLLQRENLAWAEHGFVLEGLLAGAGRAVPRRPAILEARYGPANDGGGGDGGDGGESPAEPAPAPA